MPVAEPPLAPPPAPPPPTAVSGALTPEVVWANWDNLIGQLKRMGHMPVGAFLKEAIPTAVNDQCLTLSFPANYKFHYSRVKENYHETVAKALQALYGRPLQVECVLCTLGQDPPVPGGAGAVPAEAFAEPLPPVEVPPALAPEPPVAAAPVAETVVGIPDTPGGPGVEEPAHSGWPTEEAPAPLPSLENPHGPAAPHEMPEARDPQALGMSIDEAVTQTLMNFDGSTEVDNDPA